MTELVAEPCGLRRRVPREWERAAWELCVAGMLAVLAGPSPLAIRLSGRSLAVHMLVEHALLLGSGALGAVALGRLAPVATVLRRAGAARGAGAAIFLVVLTAWHVPVLFGAAVGTPGLHAAMHLTYIAAGFSLVVALPAIGTYGRVLLLIGMQAVMGVLALAMFTGAIVYPGYLAPQTVDAGVAMLAGMQLVFPVLALGSRVSRLWNGRDTVAPMTVLLLGGVVAGSLVAIR